LTENAQAIALRDWLVGEGGDDLFQDLDPERSIAAGERWQRALNEAARRCEGRLKSRQAQMSGAVGPRQSEDIKFVLLRDAISSAKSSPQIRSGEDERRTSIGKTSS